MKINKKYLSFYYQDMEEIPDIVLDPKKTALLIVDMQKEFISREIGESILYKSRGEWERWIPFHDRLDDIVIPNTVRLLNCFRKNEMLVTFGRIACLLKNGEDRSSVQKTEGWNGIFLHVDSVEAQMVDELAPLPEEIVVNKTTDSVLAGTNYGMLMKNIGIDTIIVTGIVTDQCVAGTIRSLADAGFKVICVEDCCAAPDIKLHDDELRIMNIIYCNVLSTDETLTVLKRNLEAVET